MAITMTGDEVTRGANRFARALDALGLDPRAGVAALMPNDKAFLVAYRGSVWSGRRWTAMSWRWKPDEVDYVLGNCEARAFVAHARFQEAALAGAERIAPEARFAVGGEIPGFRPFEEILEFSDEAYPHPLAGDTMLYTSGTTGRPKGVQRGSYPEGPPPTMVGQAGAAMISAFMKSERHDGAHLVCAPLYHSGPSTYCDGALVLGADLVISDRFDPEEILQLIEAHRVQSVFMVPTHFVRLLRLPEAVRQRYDLSSLELVLHGAAPVAPEIKRRMIEWLGPVLFEFYGGTEGGGCMIGSEEWLAHPGSVGRPRPGMELRILDESGEPVAPGERGGVYFALDEAPFVYKDDPEKTAASRLGDWFTMGDIGYLDEDGYLFLCDRSADVVVSGGVNIYPAAIESVLLELECVADCCVVGAPNEEWGEEVRALVQLEPRIAQGQSEAELSQTILAHCRDRLAGYEVPRAVDFDAALPRTETGKLARRTLRERYWRDQSRRI